jgi:hypothetical protein
VKSETPNGALETGAGMALQLPIFAHGDQSTPAKCRATALFRALVQFLAHAAVWPAWVLGRVLPVIKGVNGAATTNVTP